MQEVREAFEQVRFRQLGKNITRESPWQGDKMRLRQAMLTNYTETGEEDTRCA